MDSESEGKPEVNTKEKWMENQNGNSKDMDSRSTGLRSRRFKEEGFRD